MQKIDIKNELEHLGVQIAAAKTRALAKPEDRWFSSHKKRQKKSVAQQSPKRAGQSAANSH